MLSSERAVMVNYIHASAGQMEGVGWHQRASSCACLMHCTLCWRAWHMRWTSKLLDMRKSS